MMEESGRVHPRQRTGELEGRRGGGDEEEDEEAKARHCRSSVVNQLMAITATAPSSFNFLLLPLYPHVCFGTRFTGKRGEIRLGLLHFIENQGVLHRVNVTEYFSKLPLTILSMSLTFYSWHDKPSDILAVIIAHSKWRQQRRFSFLNSKPWKHKQD
ncbi:hypothetical protein GYMLUDRAFT_579468 [Collybiopsis luxurians FD-317 M1]|uniref:Uncharacterized protein n=1 Tax=Collybiopsis luxurians FD-317 M1 TaxID=944289 RepID=A0A0D0CFE3_9AGAR|nr:hypothetical protein GYMLUDRAFT_579468 [Collybiopsis luxurians FD-317 M1]